MDAQALKFCFTNSAIHFTDTAIDFMDSVIHFLYLSNQFEGYSFHLECFLLGYASFFLCRSMIKNFRGPGPFYKRVLAAGGIL